MEGVWGNREVSPASAGAEAGRCGQYDHLDAVRRAEDRDPALDPARGAAARAALPLDARVDGRSRRLPLPRRRADRAAAGPHRPGVRAAADSPWVLDRRRLPQLCHRARGLCDRDRRDRHRPVAGGCGPDRHLPYGRARTALADGGAGGRDPPPGLARRPRAGADQGPEAGRRLRQLAPRRRPAGVHDARHRLPRGRRALGLPARVQLRAGAGGLDLHAPRHGEAVGGRRPALPATAELRLADPEARERARRLRARPGAALADHRDERRRRPLAARDARLGGGHGPVRAAVRRLGRGDGADPLSRPLARRDPAHRPTRSSSIRSRRSG